MAPAEATRNTQEVSLVGATVATRVIKSILNSNLSGDVWIINHVGKAISDLESLFNIKSAESFSFWSISSIGIDFFPLSANKKCTIPQ